MEIVSVLHHSTGVRQQQIPSSRLASAVRASHLPLARRPPTGSALNLVPPGDRPASCLPHRVDRKRGLARLSAGLPEGLGSSSRPPPTPPVQSQPPAAPHDGALMERIQSEERGTGQHTGGGAAPCKVHSFQLAICLGVIGINWHYRLLGDATPP